MTATTTAEHEFRTGIGKGLLYLRVILHVIFRSILDVLRGRMRPLLLPVYLRRALLFLLAVRHSKVAVRDGRAKLHLYIPAYPTPAFWHTLDKLRRPDPGPVTVVLSMTRACTYRCPHCYQARDRGKDLDLDRLIEVTREMQDLGVSMFDVEGGEPLLRFDRLEALVAALDDRAEIWINTTGAHLTPEMADRLAAAGLAGVMVSIHAPAPEAHDAFTGVPGAFEAARNALLRFGERGVFTAINCCPDAKSIRSGGVERLFDLGAELRCDFVQVIHGKAAGGWLGREAEVGGAPDLLAKLRDLHLSYNREKRFASHPSISAQVFEEASERFGCTAGGVDRFYLGADGEVQPCEFLNVSFGNVDDEDFGTIFSRMRDEFRVPGTDWLCCTRAESIHAVVRDRGLNRTPVPWEITREIVGSWERGEETPLYRKLGIYEQP